jgi:histidyl-tRNA synthetase
LAARVAEGLRDRGIDVLFHCGGGSFKSQMKKADASGAGFAVIVGDDEAARRRGDAQATACDRRTSRTHKSGSASMLSPTKS